LETARGARRRGKEEDVDEQAIFRKIQSILAERLGKDPEEITMESLLNEDLEVDSLDLVDLSMTLEDEYGIDILEGDTGEVITVGDVIRLVLDRLLEREGEVK
jgi:acyl carrier protein